MNTKYFLLNSIVVLLLIGCLSACYYDKESELLVIDGTECDTMSITYSAKIDSILLENCIGCHSIAGAALSGGGIVLEGYNNAKTFAQNGQLAGSIQHAQGFSPMPKNQPQLNQCSIDQINAWITAGTPQ